MKAKQRVMNGFTIDSFTVSFPGTPQWARGQFTKTFMPAGFEKWRCTKF